MLWWDLDYRLWHDSALALRCCCARRYGEKSLKCSDTPRSYYRCSVLGCSAKKYVEYDSAGAVAQTVTKVGLLPGCLPLSSMHSRLG